MPFFTTVNSEKSDEKRAEVLIDSLLPIYDTTSNLDESEKDDEALKKVQTFLESHPDIDKQTFGFALTDVFSRKVVDMLQDPRFDALNTVFNSIKSTFKPGS